MSNKNAVIVTLAVFLLGIIGGTSFQLEQLGAPKSIELVTEEEVLLNKTLLQDTYFIENGKYKQEFPQTIGKYEFETHEYVGENGKGYQTYITEVKPTETCTKSTGVGHEAKSRSYDWKCTQTLSATST